MIGTGYKLAMEQRISQKLQLVARIKLAEFLSLPEDEFGEWVRKLEENPLFQELKNRHHLINYRRFFQVVPRSSFLELKEAFISQQENINVEDLLQKDPKTSAILKKVGAIVGREKFSKLLQGKEDGMAKIMETCNLSPEERRIFRDFINRFQLEEVFLSSSSFSGSAPHHNFFRIAAIEKRDNGLFICPLGKESYLIKGKYSINYSRFEGLIAAGEFSPSQINRISKVFKKLDLTNRRTTLIYQIIYHLKEIHRPFFESGDQRDLLPLSQSELARRIGVHPSSVSRAIAFKSILTPQEEEKPLKFFFSKRRVQNFLRKIILEERGQLQTGILIRPLSDELVRKKLKERYGIRISRRSVSKYRQIMKIPSSYQRGKNYELMNRPRGHLPFTIY